MISPATSDELPERASVATSMAREMAEAHREAVEFHRDQLKMSPDEALARVGTAADQRRIMDNAPDQVSWLDLDQLARQDPKLWERRWNEISDAAREEWESGSRGARATEATNDGPWQRAQFLAIRDDVADGWKPQNGIEWTLIESIAQAYTSQLFWQERLMCYANLPCDTGNQAIKQKGSWEPPRVYESQAVDQAAAMVDRFNRIFLRTLRALRDLRKHSPTLIVQNAGQVNVADKQVNVVQDNSG